MDTFKTRDARRAISHPGEPADLKGTISATPRSLPAKSSSSASTTVALTILSNELPASSRMAWIFLKHCARLFLDGRAFDGARRRIIRGGARYEHEAGGFDGLTVSRRRFGRPR